MAESITIARQYAQAVFEIAKEGGSLPAWSTSLKQLALISKDPNISEIIGNPKLTGKQIIDAIVSLTGVTGNREMVNFVGVLLDTGLMDIILFILI